MTRVEIRHFLVMRKHGRLWTVVAFDDEDAALRQYGFEERRGTECVLLGADCLATAIRTHGSWFDQPTLDGHMDFVRATATPD